MKIDLTSQDTSSGGFEPLPEDRYDLEVVSLEERTSSSGNQLINMRFKVINNDQYNNRNLFTSFVLVENSLWNLAAFLEAAGCDDLLEREFDTAELQQVLPGRTVSAYVTIRTYNDKKSNNLSQWAPIESEDAATSIFA